MRIKKILLIVICSIISLENLSNEENYPWIQYSEIQALYGVDTVSLLMNIYDPQLATKTGLTKEKIKDIVVAKLRTINLRIIEIGGKGIKTEIKDITDLKKTFLIKIGDIDISKIPRLNLNLIFITNNIYFIELEIRENVRLYRDPEIILSGTTWLESKYGDNPLQVFSDVSTIFEKFIKDYYLAKGSYKDYKRWMKEMKKY